MIVADAVYAAAERGEDRRTASDLSIARARAVILRFLRELPSELCVGEMLRELQQPE